jgi:hypothetical protein
MVGQERADFAFEKLEAGGIGSGRSGRANQRKEHQPNAKGAAKTAGNRRHI